ncbi:hypothetical protein [Microbacterium luticocti]|uniref:hypothetical protein n=1 Tax=Microbacterium luticocti TaxID=451764 RepID=UPI000426F04F|nr:hypothetical protein [Microbacterium luticocti]
MNPTQIAEKIRDLLDKIQSKIDEITRLVNSVLSKIPFFLSWVADKVHEAWDAMLSRLKEFWDWFTDKLSYVGNPFLLNDTGKSWNTVGASVARINDTITDQALSVDDRWKGRAADQYEQSLEPQRRANTSIMSDYAANVANALSSLSTGIAAFWAGIAVALITLIGAIAGAAVATGTIVGLPAAPVLIGIGIVAFLVAAGSGVGVLLTQAGTCRTTLAATSAGISVWPKIATQ